MKIWWGWRLAFDCTLLYAFMHYFALCKFLVEFSNKPLSFRSNFVLEILEDGASQMDSEKENFPQQPIL